MVPAPRFYHLKIPVHTYLTTRAAGVSLAGMASDNQGGRPADTRRAPVARQEPGRRVARRACYLYIALISAQDLSSTGVSPRE